jgi:hypothetical protein
VTIFLPPKAILQFVDVAEAQTAIEFMVQDFAQIKAAGSKAREYIIASLAQFLWKRPFSHSNQHPPKEVKRDCF